MIFSELYSTYYQVVADILAKAIDHPLKVGELNEIVSRNAFGESTQTIVPAITKEQWPFLLPYGTTPIKNPPNMSRPYGTTPIKNPPNMSLLTTPIKNPPTMPLTILEKRWMKAVLADPRIKLFMDDAADFGDADFKDVKPLFTASDIAVFDQYSDGDPFEDEKYIKHFRLILSAIKNGQLLSIDSTNRKGKLIHHVVKPERLEYSEKDDKFRLYSSGHPYGKIINLGRIVKCKPYLKPFTDDLQRAVLQTEAVEFELVDERNALERVLLHFAHFEKKVERIEGNRYKVTIHYDKEDKTEIVIRILSFGPMVKVTEPQSFVELIRERLQKQKKW